jgi:hypothetical protein
MPRGAIAVSVAAAVAAHAAAPASETVTYTYDALGRITDVATTGGRNDGSAAATRYDPAGNRSSYTHSGAGVAAPASAEHSSSSGEVIIGLEEEGPAQEAPAAAVVEPPPPGGIPDESEPVVEIEPPEGDAAGADR